MLNSMLVLGTALAYAHAQRQLLTVANGGGNESSPLLYGALYEDLYHSGDGGHYAELIRNRAFQGSSNDVVSPFNSRDPTIDYWHPLDGISLAIDDSPPFLSDPLDDHMRVTFADEISNSDIVGFYNDGFWGMKVTSDTQYTVRLSIRGTYEGDITGAFHDSISDETLGSTVASVKSTTGQWTNVEFPVLTPQATTNTPNNTFRFVFDDARSVQGQSIDVNLLSVFPDTFKDRENGLRIDLAETFAGLGSSWTRFPGGNSMQGPGYGEEFNFSEAIGSLKDRPGMLGVWGSIFTNGLGLLEQAQWMEDTKQEIFLGIFAGLHIGGDIVPEANLQPFVQLALDELEFLLGDSSSTWGSKRAAMGRSEPFKISHVEVGNEDYLNGGTESYRSYRFPTFYRAIKARYPDMNIISTVIPAPLEIEGTWIDLHIYQGQDRFAGEYNAFDNTDRRFPVIVGEYACIFSHGNSFPEIGAQTMGMALSEGIMLLGAERNSDVIRGTAYGALNKHYDEEPDTVAVYKHTADRILKSNSYYLQQIMARYHGVETLPVSSAFGEGIDPLFWSATREANGRSILKILNYYGPASEVDVLFDEPHEAIAEVITFTSSDCESTNNFEELGGISSRIEESTLDETDGKFTVIFGSECELKILLISPSAE